MYCSSCGKNNPVTIRKQHGTLIKGQEESPATTKNPLIIIHARELRQNYQIGEVYAFSVTRCFSHQKADGTQQTQYIVKDSQGDKHSFHCDCTRYEINQEIYLRVRAIDNGQLKFENNIIERLDEIFETGKEYEFEVISYQQKRYVVCDTKIGKNHYLSSDNGLLYTPRKIIKLEVRGFDDKGNLLLVDQNPPEPSVPPQKIMQDFAEKLEKLPNSTSPQTKNQLTPSSSLYHGYQQYTHDSPKVAPGTAIPQENKKTLVKDLGYQLPEKKKKHTPKTSKQEPTYTRSKQTNPGEKVKPPSKHHTVTKAPEPKLPDEQKLEENTEATEEAVPEVVEEPIAEKSEVLHEAEVVEEVPLVESQPELLPDEAEEMSEFAVSSPFIAWADGVCGMEKAKYLTLHSGHGCESIGVELPAYQRPEVEETVVGDVHVTIQPWYKRVWLWIKSLFS